MTDTSQSTSNQRFRSGWEELLSPLRPVLEASNATKIALATVLVVLLWGVAVAAMGVSALVWPMKLIVPGMIVALVALTWSM